MILLIAAIALIIFFTWAEYDLDGYWFVPLLLSTFIVGVLALFVGLIASEVYQPNATTDTYQLQKLDSGNYIEVSGDTYTYKADDQVFSTNTSDLNLALIEDDSTGSLVVESSEWGLNVIAFETGWANHALVVPSDYVRVVS